MIVLKLTDGLGNQMFQYAFARALQQRRNDKIYLDITKLGYGHIRSYSLDQFVLNEQVIVPIPLFQWVFRVYTKIIRLFLNRILGISLVTQEGFDRFTKIGYYTTNEPIRFYKCEECSMPILFVRGFFQSDKYFDFIEDTIREDFRFKIEPNKKSLLEMKNKIKSTNSVCLHIRRGDYTKYKRFQICNEAYYREAMSYISKKVENPVFYVFSNTHEDIVWIKQNYTFQKEVEFVDLSNTELEDFYLMKECKHFVISNSTFSWWAAYLSSSKDKIVVAPYPWIRGDEYQEDIYWKDWHKINVDDLQ